MEKGQRARFIVIQKALSIFDDYRCLCAEVTVNSTVALCEGPSFFQNFQLSILRLPQDLWLN
ncbi:hypothetical protein Avbf_16050 [Armadillidium vulgare]|nr:hypothetical protein Avbf_16050 [Armadillidium vulgare]